MRGMECRFRVKNGDERVTVLSADVVIFDGEACILCALTDITDRTRAEDALRESERRFMVAFHANPLPMSITEPARPPRTSRSTRRRSATAATRARRCSASTKPDLGFWVRPSSATACCACCAREGRVRDFEVTFRTRAGEERRLLVNSEVITFGGEPAVLSVSLDITERRARGGEPRAARGGRGPRRLAPRRRPGQGRVPGHARPRAAQPARHADRTRWRCSSGSRATRPMRARGRDHRAPDRAPGPAGGRPARRGPRHLRQDRAAARSRSSCTRWRAGASTPSRRPAATERHHGRPRGRARRTCTAIPPGSSRC